MQTKELETKNQHTGEQNFLMRFLKTKLYSCWIVAHVTKYNKSMDIQSFICTNQWKWELDLDLSKTAG